MLDILTWHAEAEQDEVEEEDELLSEIDVEQAPPVIPIPAPVEPPVKRKRGRPPKNKPDSKCQVDILFAKGLLQMESEFIFWGGDWLETLLTVAAIIRVEDEATGEVDDIIVKKEVGADQDDGNEEAVEEVVVGGGKSTIQMEELSQEEVTAPEEQLSEAPPNGDLTPEMILSMMDRWWMWGSIK